MLKVCGPNPAGKAAMNLDFSAADEAFRAEARSWLRDNVPRERRPEDGREMRDFDMAWQRRQYDGGWAGIAWPKEYGGRGLPVAQQLIWYEELAKAGGPELGVALVGLSHGGPTLIARGTPEQKAFHLPKILKGDVVWSQGFSEPGAGSDLASLTTRGVVDGDHIVVTGSKIWTSYAHLSDYQELLVRTDPDSRRQSGLTWMICDMRTPGITIRPIQFINGEHHFNQVFYDEVRVPIANVVGEIGEGWSVAMSTLSFERGTGFTQAQIELAQFVDEMVKRAARPRDRSGKTWLDDPAMAKKLARLRADVGALRAMTYASVSRNMRRDQPGPDGSLVKLLLAQLRQESQRISMELLGADFATMNDDTALYLRTFQRSVGGGTNEIQMNIIAQRVLGLPKSY